MGNSRWDSLVEVDPKRLLDFVALDNLTAQVPLIDVKKSRGFFCRIWTAYDLRREYGTYTEVNASGLVRTVTIYPGGKQTEKINRPANRKHSRNKRNGTGVRQGTGQDTDVRKASGPSGIPKRAKHAIPKA